MTEERASEFLRRICLLSKGDQTALRRSLGQTLENSSGNAQAAFYKVYFSGNEPAAFFAATAVCYLGLEKEGENGKGNMGQALKLLKKDDSAGIDRKLAAILDVRIDVQPDYFSAKIGRIIRMLKQKECIPNYTRLIADITNWDHDSHFVQRKWAKDYYSTMEK